MKLFKKYYFTDYNIGFKDPATAAMEGILDLHNYILFYLIFIFVLVFFILVEIIVYFYFDINFPKDINDLKFRTMLFSINSKLVHNSTLELIWTFIPTIILILIAIPSFALLYALDETFNTYLTLHIRGHQWYWSYEYIDFNNYNKYDNNIYDKLFLDERNKELSLIEKTILNKNNIHNKSLGIYLSSIFSKDRYSKYQSFDEAFLEYLQELDGLNLSYRDCLIKEDGSLETPYNFCLKLATQADISKNDPDPSFTKKLNPEKVVPRWNDRQDFIKYFRKYYFKDEPVAWHTRAYYGLIDVFFSPKRRVQVPSYELVRDRLGILLDKGYRISLNFNLYNMIFKEKKLNIELKDFAKLEGQVYDYIGKIKIKWHFDALFSKNFRHCVTRAPDIKDLESFIRESEIIDKGSYLHLYYDKNKKVFDYDKAMEAYSIYQKDRGTILRDTAIYIKRINKERLNNGIFDKVLTLGRDVYTAKVRNFLVDFIKSYSPENDKFNTVKFDSYMVPESELTQGELRLLNVDNPLILPMNQHIRILVTSTDVLHSWAIPAFGIKIDAVPGRINQGFIFINRPGTFYGQCSEICGVNHGFMPIKIKSVSVDDYIYWLRHKKLKS